ncbi:MAG TPA: hypothetical protein VIA18_27970 [Polyangia bacterium]|nr:hypothetical protein [Polyangia bacterium]
MAFAFVALCSAGSIAAAESLAPPAPAALRQSLGSSWEVAAAGPLEAHRRPRRSSQSDFAARLQVVANQARSGGITVDLFPRSIHLAGAVTDCDRVVLTARQFAAIPGVNDLVIDTTCRPRS